MHMHTNLHTYVHTYIHTYTHAYIQSFELNGSMDGRVITKDEISTSAFVYEDLDVIANEEICVLGRERKRQILAQVGC